MEFCFYTWLIGLMFRAGGLTLNHTIIIQCYRHSNFLKHFCRRTLYTCNYITNFKISCQSCLHKCNCLVVTRRKSNY